MTDVAARSHSLAEFVSQALVRATPDGTALIVETPLVYPSGAHVAIRIDGDGKYFNLTDVGGGYLEADLMGASAIYARVARHFADARSLNFDGNAFFEIGLRREQLPIGIVALSNASKDCVERTALRLAEKNYRQDDAELLDKLVSIFGLPRVHEKPKLLGASNKEWTFTASVEVDDHQTVFDLVKPAWQSLLPSVAKFRDVKDLSGGPRRVAVVSDTSKLEASDLNLLTRTAEVIEFGARDDAYRRAA